MQNEKIIGLAKKLKALADKGVGGEKENAIAMLKRYMRKYNLSIEDLESDSKTERVFIYKNTQKILLRQIIFVVIGKDAVIYKYKTGVRNAFIVECTNEQRVMIDAMFDFYWKAFEREYDVFVNAFINRNNLFPADDEPRNLNELTPEELEKAMNMLAMAKTMKRHHFRKQIQN